MYGGEIDGDLWKKLVERIRWRGYSGEIGTSSQNGMSPNIQQSLKFIEGIVQEIYTILVRIRELHQPAKS
jgi:hypothetical protein